MPRVSGKNFISTPAQPHVRVHLEVTHLFEAEGHGEHTDSNDAVHHVHDETVVRRRHIDPLVDFHLL